MKIRLGKDIFVNWEIETSDGSALIKEDLLVDLQDPVGNHKYIREFDLEGNVVTFIIPGNTFKLLGSYVLTLWKDKDKSGRTMVDVVNAFELVKYTEEEDIECNTEDTDTETDENNG